MFTFVSKYARASAVAWACCCTAVTAFAAFTDVSSQVGISYLHSQKGDGVNNHGGAGALDVNGDGLTDLIFARFGAHPLLFVNKGSGQFEDETAIRGLSGAKDAAGFGAGDFDNDGDQDIYMTVHEGSRFFLFINDGTGVFSEVAVERGADLSVSEVLHKGYSVGVVDYNLDGYLDLYVSEWGVGRSGSEQALHSALLRNRGVDAPGHFEVVTEQAGLLQPVKTDTQHGFSSAWADFDGDGWPDLALVADYGKSQMYWNNGDGTFTNGTAAAGVGFDENGMGVAVADYDGDGLLDFYVTSIFDDFSNKKDGTHTGNKLYKNQGNRNFQEVSVPQGVSRTGWGWGAAFLDYENDGDFDLAATNGMPISEGADPATTPYAAAATDATTLFLNDGTGQFAGGTAQSGIADNRYGKSLVVLDYDNDGDEDLVIANSHSDPIFYRSDASTNGNRWIRFAFEGTVSNRDGIGTVVTVTDGGETRTLSYNPSNAYLGPREPALHFGLGSGDSIVDSVEIRWPTGFTQTLTDVAVDQVKRLLEPDDVPLPPQFTKQPSAQGSFGFGDELRLTVDAMGQPEPVFVWEKDGQTIEGANEKTLRIKRLAPWDAGLYRAKAINSGGEALSNAVVVELDIDVREHSVARWWNEFMLEAIRRDFPDPTKHSRNLYHVSAAMWDAFWAYEEEAWSRAKPMFLGDSIDPADWGTDRERAQSEAISHAAFTVLMQRYKDAPGAERSAFGFRWLMADLGFNPDNVSLEGKAPAAVGNRIGNAVLALNYEDGSNELGDYADVSGYEAVNQPLVLEIPGTVMTDINRWQPLAFDFAVSQNGIPIGALVQSFLGVNWREVTTFAIKKPSSNTIAFDPGPPPLMGGDSEEAFKEAVVEVIRYSSYLDPADETVMDISPGAYLNNSLGSNEGVGHPLNPFTGEPYPSNRVKRADYGRILAEFWADGPASETPPGHWNTLHNEVADHPLFERRYMGVGEVLSPLEWDVRAYLAINGGMHDAAVAAWTLKRQYDYSRPISMIRALAGNGQSSDPAQPSYSEDGIPLVTGLIELVTEASSAPGERHAHLASGISKVALRAWTGEPQDARTEVGGVGWILAENWLPYQRASFVSPAFAAYVSGHSTFSRNGAEIMTLLTGSPFFPGGIGEFVFPKGEYLEFEDGPSEDVTLQWATYYDAADQAGLSRLYGGIHVEADDVVGRVLGARIGVEAFLRAHQQRNAASGTGLFREIRLERSLEGGDAAAIARFESEAKELTIRQIRSSNGDSYRDADGIYFIFPDRPKTGGLSSDPVAISGVGPMRGARFQTELRQGETLSVLIEVDAEEPVVLLARAEGASLAGGVSDTRLRVFRLDGSGAEIEVASNDDWRESLTSSQAEVLLLRESEAAPLADQDAAIAASLSSGVYRFVLEGVAGEGRAALVARGGGWRE